jgi:hypothetical protein
VSADYTVKVGVIPGPLVVRLSYADGSAPVPALTTPGTTAELRMRRVQGTTTLLVKAMTIVDADTVSYDWQAGDLDLALGAYEAEIHVDYASGKRSVFPMDPDRPYLIFSVQEAIGPLSA